MNITINVPTEVTIAWIRISVPVRYEEEDMPNDFPMRVGDTWTVTVDIDTGAIYNWPKGKTGKFYMKVCDEGEYSLIGLMNGNAWQQSRQGYVPSFIPSEYGDYLNFSIDENGKIANWRPDPEIIQNWLSGQQD